MSTADKLDEAAKKYLEISVAANKLSQVSARIQELVDAPYPPVWSEPAWLLTRATGDHGLLLRNAAQYIRALESRIKDLEGRHD